MDALIAIAVNPTHVGMDLHTDKVFTPDLCKPHARGDGPNIALRVGHVVNVNPTHVGMDR